MKKPTILNILYENFEILEERVVDEKLGTKEMDVKVKWGQAAPYVNINDRAYRPELMEREIKKINERIASGNTVWGCSYHPADGLGTTADISHKWTKVWMEKDGTCKGTLTLLPTTEGKNIQELVKRGKLGISSRGFGNVTEKEMKVDGKTVKYKDVNDDFRLVNPGDFVVSPSVEGAGNIAEEIGSLESELNKDLDSNSELKEWEIEKKVLHKYQLIHASHQKSMSEVLGTKEEDEMGKTKTSEKAIQTLLQEAYKTSMKSTTDGKYGATKTFEQWKKDGGEVLVRASVAYVIDGEYDSIEEALENMGTPKIVAEYVTEQKKVTPAECYTEAAIAGIDPQKMADIINKSIDEETAAIGTGWSSEERQVIYNCARQAGKNIGTAEARKKLLDETKVLPENDKETQFEAEVQGRYKQMISEGEDITLEGLRKVMKRQREKKEEEEAKQARIQSTVRENILAGPAKVFK